MVGSEEKQRLKRLLSEAILLLCKNGLPFSTNFCLEALIGVTLDESEVVLFSFKENFECIDENSSGNYQQDGETMSSSRLDMTSDNMMSAAQRKKSSHSTQHSRTMAQNISDSKGRHSRFSSNVEQTGREFETDTNLATPRSKPNARRLRIGNDNFAAGSGGDMNSAPAKFEDNQTCGDSSGYGCDAGENRKRFKHERNSGDNEATEACIYVPSVEEGRGIEGTEGEEIFEDDNGGWGASVKDEQGAAYDGYGQRYGDEYGGSSGRGQDSHCAQAVENPGPSTSFRKRRGMADNRSGCGTGRKIGLSSLGAKKKRVIVSQATGQVLGDYSEMADCVLDDELRALSNVTNADNPNNISGDDHFDCRVCGATLKGKHTLRDHIRGKHLSLYSFRCPDCGLAFKWRSTLKSHREQFHTIGASAGVSLPAHLYQ